MRPGFPFATRSQVIGLLGGSFDPAHAGHVHITREAMKRFGLTHVWWLVTPGNPLKSEGPASMARRMKAARRLMRHPRVTVTDIEARLGTRYTARTLAALHRRYPGVRFVWLMGADNLTQFDRWQDWRSIMATTSVGVLARPDHGLAARGARASRIMARVRLNRPDRLGRARAPAWAFAEIPMVNLSSSEIRARGEWPRVD